MARKKMKEFDILVCLDDSNAFVVAHIKKRGSKAKIHKRVDYKERGTVFKHMSRNGKIIATTFLRPNDFWRFMKALVIKETKGKKNVARN